MKMDRQIKMNIIDKYVNEDYFDKQRLLKYLNTHDTVGNEVFSYVNKVSDRNKRTALWLDDEYGYEPIAVDRFIKRIPFYFYVPDNDALNVGDLGCLISGLYDKNDYDWSLENLYVSLEELLYIDCIPLEDIMEYTVEQTGYVSRTALFFQWVEYVKLCRKLGWEDKLPANFIYRYNEALEKVGKHPVIYEIQEMYIGEFFHRNGDKIEFEGIFPFDNYGNPEMKWIGLKIKNSGAIEHIKGNHGLGSLIVHLKPNTLIYALNCYNYEGEGNKWYQIYAGPQLMSFNNAFLKIQRKGMKYTQQQVANAIGTSVRTYQKWENGDTIPDGHNLIRLMNYLDITDVQMLIKYNEKM